MKETPILLSLTWGRSSHCNAGGHAVDTPAVGLHVRRYAYIY